MRKIFKPLKALLSGLFELKRKCQSNILQQEKYHYVQGIILSYTFISNLQKQIYFLNFKVKTQQCHRLQRGKKIKIIDRGKIKIKFC